MVGEAEPVEAGSLRCRGDGCHTGPRHQFRVIRMRVHRMGQDELHAALLRIPHSIADGASLLQKHTMCIIVQCPAPWKTL